MSKEQVLSLLFLFSERGFIMMINKNTTHKPKRLKARVASLEKLYQYQQEDLDNLQADILQLEQQIEYDKIKEMKHRDEIDGLYDVIQELVFLVDQLLPEEKPKKKKTENIYDDLSERYRKWKEEQLKKTEF